MTHFHAGYNDPGYLPDNLPTIFPTFAEAADSLGSDLGMWASDVESWVAPHDCDDIPCPTYGDDCAWNKAKNIEAAREALEAVNTQSTEWQESVEGVIYWIMLCEEDCLDD